MTEEQQYKEVFDQWDNWDKEVYKHNQEILKSIEGYNDSDFKDLMDEAEIRDMMSIEDKPSGENQNESAGIFKNIYVDQWSTNEAGDSFSGNIYAEIGNNKWLKIPFYC